MTHHLIFGALSFCILATSAPAMADDPYDPAMRNRAVREADAAEIRRLNNEQARYVRERDARLARSNQQSRERAAQQYDRSRADYEARMEEWRRAARLCRQGRYEYCD